MPPKKRPSGPAGGIVEQYRFTIGTQVLCRTGPDEWSMGKIVALNYSEPDWPPGRIVPYQVQLNDGRLIFVPRDLPQLCRKYTPPWWVPLLSQAGSHYAKNPDADRLKKEGVDEDVNEKDHRGHTPLLECARFRWTKGVSQLVSMKADVNIANNEKVHPLHFATEHNAELMQILLDAKADPNCQDQDPDYDPNFTSKSFGDTIEHRTPLHYVAAEVLDGSEKKVSVLVQAKADLDMADAHGATPLHLAIEEDNTSIIACLLQSKADVNVDNMRSKMESPLMHAAHAGKDDLAKQLIEAKADVNHQGKQGLSALHMGARRGNTNACRILISAGADKFLKSDLGTPVDLAKKNGGVQLLEVFGVGDAPKDTSNVTYIGSLDAAQRAALFLE